MFFDANHMAGSTLLNFDVCIIGGGVAGITIARRFMGTNTKVALLESGDHKVDGRTQALYAGSNVGLPYERLSTARSRYFGGSSNCWGGFSRPFERLDLAKRPWVPNSGWPLTWEELEPHYAEAHRVLDLGPVNYDIEYWRERLHGENVDFLPVTGPAVLNRVSQLNGPLRMGKAYRAEIERADNVSCILNANVTEIEADAYARTVQRVHVATLGGQRLTVAARFFVLCAGGIENARLLLVSDRVQSCGLGNEHDRVGRYFTDHPRVKSSVIRLADQKRHRRLYDMTLCLSRRRLNIQHLPINAALSPSDSTQRELGLLNSRSYLVAQYHGEATKAYKALADIKMLLSNRGRYGMDLREVATVLRDSTPAILPHVPLLAYALFDNLINPEWRPRAFTLETVLEPAPNPDSRVTLGTERDALGLRLPRVDWRLTDLDRENFIRTHDLIRSELARAGLILDADEPVDVADCWPERIGWCWHHMGTTRMSDDPRQGVVNADCRVHGIDNLYIGGSSVFPTMGADHPTLNLTVLALRLSDHLAGRLRSQVQDTTVTARAANF